MQLDKGATTLTEKWDGGNSSNDHLMLGHGELWFYRGLAGIQTAPESVAFDKLIIRPQVVEKLAEKNGEKFARATVNTVRGPIVSNWSLKGKALTMNVTVPPTATATIYVPAADPTGVKVSGGGTGAVTPGKSEQHVAAFTAKAGTYQFEAVLP
jgi:alpha-L-rhamnosidase